MRDIHHWKSDTRQYQRKILRQILLHNKSTEYGKLYNFSEIRDYQTFDKVVRPVSYEDLYPYIRRMMDGEPNILCRDQVDWFAKSSGTSSGKSKYIPVTKRFLKEAHLKCAWEAAAFVYNEDPDANLFKDKSLIMGGSLEELESGKFAGDISAIILKHFPPIGRAFYTPDFTTALMSDWEAKIHRMAAIVRHEHVCLIGGVPTWTKVLLEEVIRQSGGSTINQIWPGLRSYLHGGIGFEPYRAGFATLLEGCDVRYREVYNASEGYFAIQNEHEQPGMLLLTDHAIFYEFIDMEEFHQPNRKIIPLEKVETDKNYAMVITTSSGLYRYIIGDTVSFVQCDPYKIKVTGRTGQQLNVFGEELSVANAETALAYACRDTLAIVENFTIAPQFMRQEQSGCHEWFIEFNRPPENPELFVSLLDAHLKSVNSDYEAKRSYDMVMQAPKLTVLPANTFASWQKENHKYGGQHKVPRMRNDREFAKQLLQTSASKVH